MNPINSNKSRSWTLGMAYYFLVFLACRTSTICTAFVAPPGTPRWPETTVATTLLPLSLQLPQQPLLVPINHCVSCLLATNAPKHMGDSHENYRNRVIPRSQKQDTDYESSAKEDKDHQDTEAQAIIPPNSFTDELSRYPALILNADYQPMSYLPLSVSHWQEAIKLIFSGKVAVVDVYEGVFIRAANFEVPLPSVIALNEYVPQCSHKPAFTRRNVFLRDEYTCQYCNCMFHAKDLSIDHVVPRCMGGRLTWDNAVTSCLTCNGRKGNKLVSDLKPLGMKLHRKPRAPTRHELALKAGKMLPRKVHSTWQPFLMSLWEEPNDGADPSNSRPDMEALGINFHGEALQRKLQHPDHKPRKVISKNNQKKAKKQQQDQKDLQDSVRLR